MRCFISTPFLLFLVLFTGVGCWPNEQKKDLEETEEPVYRRAQRYERENRYDDALDAYLKVIRKRYCDGQESPESHLATAQIYLNRLEDPISSIHHLREYLRIMPNSEQSEKVRDMVKSARKEFASNLPGKPYENQASRVDLMDMLKRVREQNLRLKKQLATANERLRSQGLSQLNQPEDRDFQTPDDPAFYTPPGQNTSQSNSSPNATNDSNQQSSSSRDVPSNYTVQSGDSLYRISTQVYGSGAHWRSIFEANRGRLDSPQSLRPGMVLEIPENP